jgi:hypothetical protein
MMQTIINSIWSVKIKAKKQMGFAGAGSWMKLQALQTHRARVILGWYKDLVAAKLIMCVDD